MKNPRGAVVVGHLGRPLRQCTATKFVEDVSHLGSFGSWVMRHFETIGCKIFISFRRPKQVNNKGGERGERESESENISLTGFTML